MRFGLVRWFAGLLAVALVWAGANLYLQQGIEAELSARAARALSDTAAGAEPWAKVAARGRDLEIEGEAPSAEDKQRVLSALKRIAGVRLIRDGATVAAQPNFFAWSATRTRGRVVLSGVSPAGARDDVAGEARRLFPHTEVVDRTRAADGAPEGFAAAAAVALRELARMGEGSAAIEGTRLALSGAAPDVAAYAAVRAARNELPPAFSLDLSGLAPAAAHPFALTLTREGNNVVLAGYAPSEQAQELLMRALGKALPEAKVSGDLRIAAGFPKDADFGATVGFAAATLADLTSGSVSLTDGVVNVRGAAPDRQGAVDVAARGRDTLPAGLRLGKVSVTSAPVARYRLVARRTADGLELSGHYPDAPTRTAVSETLNQLYFERIADALRLGDGAPRGYAAAATFALEQLSQLGWGEAEIEGGKIRIAGETSYPQLAQMLRERIPRTAPAGWAATADIKADPPATASLR
jgi:hypothetical protein